MDALNSFEPDIREAVDRGDCEAVAAIFDRDEVRKLLLADARTLAEQLKRKSDPKALSPLLVAAYLAGVEAALAKGMATLRAQQKQLERRIAALEAQAAEGRRDG